MPPSSLELLERWRGRDERAADELYRRYVARLGNVVVEHLSLRFRQRVDPEDVVQSTFRSFFRRSGAGEFHFDDDVDLWKLLVTIALNKSRRTVRRQSAHVRDVSKEATLSADGMESIARGPQPEEMCTVMDLATHLCDSLGDQYGQALKLRLEGHSQQEVAAALGVTDRTVRRMMEQIREQLSAAQAET